MARRRGAIVQGHREAWRHRQEAGTGQVAQAAAVAIARSGIMVVLVIAGIVLVHGVPIAEVLLRHRLLVHGLLAERHDDAGHHLQRQQQHQCQRNESFQGAVPDSDTVT